MHTSSWLIAFTFGEGLEALVMSASCQRIIKEQRTLKRIDLAFQKEDKLYALFKPAQGIAGILSVFSTI